MSTIIDPPPRTGYSLRARHRSKRKARFHARPRNKEGKRLYAPYGHDTTIRKCGHLLSWSEMNPHERGITSRRLKGAHTRNRYWKAHGYPNLKKATAARLAKREERIRAGIVPVKGTRRVKRFERLVAGVVEPRDANEARELEIFASGREQRKTNVLLGDIPVAGLCDPAYLMRREMRILEVMSRCAN